MSKLHIKKNDTVIVLSGEDKGKTGKVLKVFVDENRALVEGIRIVSKSTKPSAKKSSRRNCKTRSTNPYLKFKFD